MCKKKSRILKTVFFNGPTCTCVGCNARSRENPLSSLLVFEISCFRVQGELPLLPPIGGYGTCAKKIENFEKYFF
jgi:hypothetical protein